MSTSNNSSTARTGRVTTHVRTIFDKGYVPLASGSPPNPPTNASGFTRQPSAPKSSVNGQTRSTDSPRGD